MGAFLLHACLLPLSNPTTARRGWALSGAVRTARSGEPSFFLRPGNVQIHGLLHHAEDTAQRLLVVLTEGGACRPACVGVREKQAARTQAAQDRTRTTPRSQSSIGAPDRQPS